MNADARPSGLMAALRAATADLHAATEELPLMRAVLAPEVDVAAYRAYLVALHQVYLSLEPVLHARCDPSLLERLGIRPKLPALAADLATLGVCEPPAPPAAWPARMDAIVRDAATAPGGLYVLEGATLGGHVIARRLRQRHWSGAATPALTFLEAGGPNPGIGWRRFSTALEDWASRADDRPARIIAGAVAVFGALHAALGEVE